MISQHRADTSANVEKIEPYKRVARAAAGTWFGTNLVLTPHERVTASTGRKYLTQHWHSREMSDRFDVLAQREDNWDGYESKKPTELTLKHARHLMEELLDSINSAGHLWLTPFISTDEDGNVTAEWYEGTRQLHIQIGENETEYLQVWGTNIDTEMHEDVLNRDDYLTLWEWLLHE